MATMPDQPRTRIKMSEAPRVLHIVGLREDGTRGDEPPKHWFWRLRHRRRERSQRSSSRASGTVTQR